MIAAAKRIDEPLVEIGTGARFAALAALACIVAVPLSAQSGDMKVCFEVHNSGDFALLATHKVSVENRNGKTVCARIEKQTLEILRHAGFAVRVTVPDIDSLKPTPPEIPDAEDYHDYEEMVAAMETAESLHSDIAKAHTIGTSIEGRDIIAMKISDNVNTDENEPEILFDAAIHGNEWTGMEVAIHLIEYLTDNYGSEATIKELVDTREIWVVPMVNPDGVAANTRENSAGVDCNRDYGYMWDGWGGSQAPYSQPETRAMQRLADENQFVMATSFHSGNEVFVFAWSFTHEHTVDVFNYRAIGAGYGTLGSYPFRQSADEEYYIVGSSKDANYGSFGALGWTIELSKDKIPPHSEIPSLCARNELAMLFLIWASGQGLTGIVTDADTGDPLPAVIEIVDLDWVAYADPEFGDFHRFLIPGAYDVSIWANGYSAELIENVEVVEGAQTDISIQLKRDESAEHHGYKLLYNTFNADAGTATVAALGAPDDASYPLGAGGYVVLDLGPRSAVADGAGADVTVLEGDDTGDGFELYASIDFEGPWVALGGGAGTTSFDLQSGGLGSARFFRIVDDGVDDTPEDTVHAGFDLDAIAGSPNSVGPVDALDSGIEPDGGERDGRAPDGGDSSDSVDTPPEFVAFSGACGCRGVGSDLPQFSSLLLMLL